MTPPCWVNLTALPSRLIEHLPQPVRVAQQPRQRHARRVGAQRQTLAHGRRGHGGKGLFQDVRDVERHDLDAQLAGLDLREIEDVVDHVHQVLGRLVDDGRAFVLFGRERRVEQQRRHAEHAVHRRADLVAHAGEELALGPRRRFRRVARLAQLGLVAQPRRHVGDETRGAAVEGEDPDLENPGRPVGVELDLVRRVGRGALAAGGAPGRQRGPERRQGLAERPVEDGGLRHAGRPHRRVVPGFDAAVRPCHEHAFVDGGDDAAQALLRELRALQHGGPADHPYQQEPNPHDHAEAAGEANERAPRDRVERRQRLRRASILLLLDRGNGLAQAVEPRFVAASEVVDPGLLEHLDGSSVLAGLARGHQLPHDGRHSGLDPRRAVPRLLDLVPQVGDRAEAVQQSPVHQPGRSLGPLMIAVLGRGHAEREHGADDHDHGGREMPAHPGATVRRVRPEWHGRLRSPSTRRPDGREVSAYRLVQTGRGRHGHRSPSQRIDKLRRFFSGFGRRRLLSGLSDPLTASNGGAMLGPSRRTEVHREVRFDMAGHRLA